MSHDFLFGQKPLPYFKLPNSNGREISGWNFRQHCPLAIAVLHDPDCKECLNWLKENKQLGEHIHQIGGKLLIIVPVPATKLASLQTQCDNTARLLADPNDSYRKKLMKINLAGTNPVLLIVDRYGDPVR
jgi:peroxiredoxin